MNLNRLISPLKDVAYQAGALELKYYNDGTDVMRKGDGSPVTLADQEAEEIILAVLRDITPDIPIIAEESVAAGRIPDISGGTFWLVDPLDGTKEFVKQSGEFTVNIALLQNFQPVLGVIYAPVVDEMYVGYGDDYAERTINGETVRIKTRPVPADGLTVVASRSHANMDELSVYLKGKNIKDTAFRGSSLKICQIAAGEADLYPRLAPTSEWDIAAGHAIIKAAGGSLTKIDGTPMVYGKVNDNFLNPHFLVTSER